jgi:hypothetical protein
MDLCAGGSMTLLSVSRLVAKMAGLNPGRDSSGENENVTVARMEKFYEELVRIAKEGQDRTPLRERATAARRQINHVLSELPNGERLTQDFSFTLNYFATALYWRGYRDARRHYETVHSSVRPPIERRDFHTAVRRMLERNIDITTEEICEALHRRGIAATFDRKGNKHVDIGPDGGDWREEANASYVKQAISRLRKDVKRKLRAEGRLQLSLQTGQRKMNSSDES